MDFLPRRDRSDLLLQLLVGGRQREDGLLVGLLADLRAAVQDVFKQVALSACAEKHRTQLVADVEEEVGVFARVLAHAVRQRTDSA